MWGHFSHKGRQPGPGQRQVGRVEQGGADPDQGSVRAAIHDETFHPRQDPIHTGQHSVLVVRLVPEANKAALTVSLHDELIRKERTTSQGHHTRVPDLPALTPIAVGRCVIRFPPSFGSVVAEVEPDESSDIVGVGALDIEIRLQHLTDAVSHRDFLSRPRSHLHGQSV